MQDISFTDKTFDSNQTLLYHLSIQISLDGFSYCILDIPKGKYVLLKEYPLSVRRSGLLAGHIRDIVEKEEVLNREFKSVDILYSTSRFTLVPQAIYSEGAGKKFFNFNNITQKDDCIEKTLLTQAKAYCIYDMPENLKDFISEKFPKSKLYHHIFPLIQTALQQNRNTEGRKKIHINFFRDNFDIIVIEGSELLLYNNFNFKNEKDVIYYVMYIFDQLKLSPESSEVVFHGKLSTSNPHYTLLKKYVSKVSFSQLDSAYLYSYTFNKVPSHYYSSLFNVYKCG